MFFSADLKIEAPSGAYISIASSKGSNLVVNCGDRSSLKALIGYYKRSSIRKRVGTVRPVNPLDQNVVVQVKGASYLTWKANKKPRIGSLWLIWLYLFA